MATVFLRRLQTALRKRYSIAREIGHGGTAIVYLAQDLKHQRAVALKVLRPELSAALGPERFLREIRVTARLQHPLILPLLDSGQSEGLLYYVMPYVEGESLRQRLDRDKQLPIDEALRLAGEVAEALESAHHHGIIHRDVKPENILLSGGHALTADFGVARALNAAGGERLTETGLAVGTPAYMSPEQAAGHADIDGRSDIYNLGCVLYEMLAGHPPFLGATPQEIMARHSLDPIPPLRSVRPALAEPIEKVVVKALGKAPADRFATATAFRGALATVAAVQASGEASRATSGLRRRQIVRRSLYALGLLAVLTAVYGLFSRRLAFTPPGPSAAPARSIAVLPCDNLSADRTDDYFSDGVAEELSTALHKVPGLRVVGRASSLAVRNSKLSDPDVGRELHVGTLLKCALRRSGRRVRVNAELINVATGYQLWSDEYERDVKDVFAVQDEITRAIVKALQVTLASSANAPLVTRSTASPEAYDLYLKGRYFFGRRTEPGMLRKSAAYFEQATRADSLYASAYSGLSDAYSVLSIWGYEVSREGFSRARAAAQRALRLDSTIAEAHTSLAIVSLYYDWDWPAAQGELTRALALDPQYPQAHLFLAWYSAILGQPAKAVEEAQRARELDPLSVILNARLGTILFLARRYEEAIAQLRKTLELDSTAAMVHAELARAAVQLGRCPDALAAIRFIPASFANFEAGFVGHAYAACGYRAQALLALADLEERAKHEYILPLRFAPVYVALGDRDQAFLWLQRGVRQRDPALPLELNADPLYDGLRPDPRFARLLKQVGLGP